MTQYLQSDHHLIELKLKQELGNPEDAELPTRNITARLRNPETRKKFE